MNARPKRRGRRDDGRRSFRLDAAKCASTGEAPVADDILFDRRISISSYSPINSSRRPTRKLRRIARIRSACGRETHRDRPQADGCAAHAPASPRRAESSRAFPFCPSRAASTTCANSYRVAEAGAPTRSIALCSGAANQCGPSTQGFRDRRSLARGWVIAIWVLSSTVICSVINTPQVSGIHFL